ncbi:MAG TPA: carboxymuconolactone decarboxylase family protein [Candidatus Binatia bacterium]|nr:carboxymuconolactone decarboxylase family protein [Candidatus Binatia bacterium]
MARLPYVMPEQAVSPEVKQTFAQLPTVLNVFKMMAHAETTFRPLVRLGSAILAQQKLSAKLRELAILRVANLSPCRYEWVQHVSLAMLMGVTRLQVDAIERDEIHAPCFDEAERLVLELATELTRGVRGSEATFERLRERFSPQEIVELILAVGYYMMVSRLIETTGVEIEPPSEHVASQARNWRSK